jgi:NitT/TauT family transport system ATP-binding protein
VPENAIIDVRGLRKRYISASGTVTEVIDGIDFTVASGEFLAVLGPSGCGKTTLLRCLSGLLAPDAGTVEHDGAPASGVPPWASVVFQEYNRTLFPWLTVEKNVRFGLSGRSEGEPRERALHALESVHLADFADYYPWQLSGGMQQRVAIARAIATGPRLLLMDEPFASVDALTRIHLEDMLLELWQELRFSAVFVTHDIEEAIYLADRVLTLSRRPSTVLAELDVDIPRPRDQLETKALPAFQELRSQAFRLVESASGRGGASRTKRSDPMSDKPTP